MSSNDARKITRKFERRYIHLEQLCAKQIKYLWKKHTEVSGKGSAVLRAGLIGKIVGIEWVLEQLKQLERKDEVNDVS